MEPAAPITPPPVFFDYHSHHVRCGHAEGAMRDYIEAALGLGMTTFGVSDHGPAYFLPGDHDLPGTQMAVSQFPAYVAEARRLQSEYAGRIAVKMGVEADFVEGHEEKLRALLQSQQLDYALGSVHYVGGVSIFNKARWEWENAQNTYREYYRLIVRAAQSGLFDVLSHLTAGEAYGPPITDEVAGEWYPRVADAAKASGAIVEVNTSGYRKMGGDEPFPNRRLLRLLIARGVPLTFGSDCHRPHEVGFGRDRVLALLAELGVNTNNPRLVQTQRGALWAFTTGETVVR